VGSGDRQAASQGRDLGEQIGPMQLALGRLALRILGPNRGRVDNLGSRGDVGAGVTEDRLDAQPAQALGVGRFRTIRAGHLGAERVGNQR
jgi:hypothetical protein